MNLGIQNVLGASPSEAGAPSVWSAATALRALLDHQSEFIRELTDEQYMASLNSKSSSIGHHTRHTLDHVNALLHGVLRGMIDYDARERGTNVERCRTEAIRATEVSAERLSGLRKQPASIEIDVRTLLSVDGASIVTRSSLGRELVFVLNHTVHHHAMMAMSARTLNAPVPPRFGYAPSTLIHQGKLECARSAS